MVEVETLGGNPGGEDGDSDQGGGRRDDKWVTLSLF